MFQKTRALIKPKKSILLVLSFLVLIGAVNAQTEYDFPAGDFWSLDAGVAISNFDVRGVPVQFVIDPKLWLSPEWMVGTRVGLNYSTEADSYDILTMEGQVYMRWNFLRLGDNPERTTNIFAQGGFGFMASYRGWDNPFDDVTRTRGSVLVDVAAGVTIPLSSRWHIEPSARIGYPHIWGVSLTAGYKFPLPRVAMYQMAPTRVELIETIRTLDPVIGALPPSIGTVGALDSPPPNIEYVEVVRTVPPNIQYVDVIRVLPPTEIVRRTIIPAIEFILFGPDIGSYNVGIDRDAQQLNELVLTATAQMLRDNADLKVRIEGHANPYTINRSEHDELMVLSTMRANVVAGELRARGVSDDQMVIIAFGGTRNATSEWDVRNRNRRVEMMLIKFDSN